MEISWHTKTFSLLFFFIFSRLAPSKACHPVDKEALLDFKHRITDDPSKLLLSWTASSDCCASWEGVACDASGRVVDVSRPGLVSDNDFVEDTYMSGTLSPSLGNLSSLQLLDLSNLKDLKGPIPQELGKLSKLTHLFLNTNKLTGSIPITLRYFSQLKKIYLSDNFLSGDVPPSVMKSWTSVSELGLSGNALSGSIPPPIGKLVMITKLDLHGNNFTGSIPTSIGNLKNLKYLDLSENQIAGSIPQSIGGLAALELLYLNQITSQEDTIYDIWTWVYDILSFIRKQIPSSFVNLLNLQTLDLSRNRLSGQLPPQLEYQTGSGIKSFRLMLAKTGIEGELPHWLSSSSISQLDLSSNALTGKLPWWIGNMTRLSFLNLSNNGFHSSIPVEFKNLSLLMDLDIHSNKFSGRLNVIFSKEVQDR
uniref:Leucine-rich repeat-containing N-terminal plant-type domain-containing protein n=1 Tax=Salix viminalis TaxID=40686 RepID=A0A6N2N3N0_SALVM